MATPASRAGETAGRRQPQPRQGARDRGAAGAVRGRDVSAPPRSACPSRRRPARPSSDNAELKARAAAEASGLPALADDSGLVVPALGGAPGIYSARWAGPDKDFRVAMERVQRELGDEATGSAHFVCVLALAWPDGAIAMLPRRGARQAGLAAARRARLRLRPDVRARRLRADLRRDGPGREAPHQPPRPGFREAGRGVLSSDRTATPTLPARGGGVARDALHAPPPQAGEGRGGG